MSSSTFERKPNFKKRPISNSKLISHGKFICGLIYVIKNNRSSSSSSHRRVSITLHKPPV
jgi:hypothetical protein